MVIFNSYVNLPEGNHHLIEGPGWFQRKPCCRWRPVLHLGGLKSVTVFLLDQPFGGVSEHGVGTSQNGSFFISDTYDIMINLVDLGYLFGPKSVLDLEMIWFRRVQKNFRMWPVWSVPLPRTCLSSIFGQHAARSQTLPRRPMQVHESADGSWFAQSQKEFYRSISLK